MAEGSFHKIIEHENIARIVRNEQNKRPSINVFCILKMSLAKQSGTSNILSCIKVARNVCIVP